VLFTKIDDKLMSSSDEVEAYVKNNPDTNKNNARRNKLLKEHYKKRKEEHDADPVGFLLKYDKDIKRMSERLETLPEIEREAAESELRKTLSEETDRLMTNAEVDEVGKIDDYQEKSDTVKKLIETRGEGVIDELVDRKALSEGFIGISNFSGNVSLQYKAFRLLKNEDEIKKMSRNADVSYTSVEKTLKDSDSFVNFAESIRGIHGGERYANSVAKLTVLEALKTGNVDDDPLENIFKEMLGDSWVYEKTLLPKKITETKAITRFSNIKDADVLAEKLKKNGAFYFNTFAGHKEIDEDSFMSLAESVESEEVDFAVRDNKVSFVKDGMFILKKDGSVYTIPFDVFDDERHDNILVDKVSKTVDKHSEIISNPIKSLYDSIFGD
jgi:hypothetical protein